MRSPRLTSSLAAAVVAAGIALWASPAAAQHYATPQDYYYGPRITGAFRIGLDVPYGSAFSGMRLRDLFSPQLGLTGELGVRVNPQVTLGGYLGVGIGDTGKQFDAWCGTADCSSFSFRLGLMGQYAFAPPWAPAVPWIGYGFGFTASAASGDERGYSLTQSYVGFDLAHLMAGVDLRPSGRVGVGFYVDYSIGVYTAYHWEENDVTVDDGRIRRGPIHHWLSFGPRISF